MRWVAGNRTDGGSPRLTLPSPPPGAERVKASPVRSFLVAALTFGAVCAVVYIGTCALLWAYEPAFVFHRIARHSTPPPAGLGGFSEIGITTADGARLYGWWRPPSKGHGVVLFLNGTGLVLSDTADFLGDLASQGFGVGGIDYRGIGASEGTPSEPGWRADADALFDFAHRRAPGAKVAAVGVSFGTGLAVALANERPLAGILLISPYASVVRLFEQNGIPLLPGVPLPARWLMTDKFDSEALVRRVHVPIMILHGTADRTIPVEEARRLYAAANQPKKMIEVAGAGHCAVWFGPTRAKALAALAAWTEP